MLFGSTQGNGDETLVLLHGFGGSHEQWQPLAELAEHMQMLAYDLPGHGRSLDFPHAGPAKVAARAVLDDLDARRLEEVHLAGHSMGGAVACLIATAAPERVKSLTLLAPGGFGEEINAPLLRRYAMAKSPQEIRTCLRAMSGPGVEPADQTVAALAKMRAIAGQTEMLARIVAAITANGRQGVIPKDRLSALAMPVSVEWGPRDPVLPFSQALDLPPQFELIVADGAGHMLVEERPSLLATVIRKTVGR